MDLVTITISSNNADDLKMAEKDVKNMLRGIRLRSQKSNRKFGHIIKIENTKTGKFKKKISRSLVD